MTSAAAETARAQSPRFRGSLLLRGLRAAWPSYAGALFAQGIVVLFTIALVLLFPGNPAAIGRVGILVACLAFVTAIGTAGLDSGLVQLYPERPEDRDDLLVTALVGALLFSAAAVAAIEFVPGLAQFLMGESVPPVPVAPFLWKAPALAYLGVAAAATYATNSLRAKAAIEAGECLAAAAFAVVGAVIGGLSGLFWGSFAGTVLVAGAIRRRSGHGRFRPALLVDLLRRGWRRAALVVLQAALPLVVLRASYSEYPDATGLLVVSMGLVLSIAALPEILAQALHPTRIGRAGPDDPLERARRRLSGEILAATAVLFVALVLAAYVLVPPLRGGIYGLVWIAAGPLTCGVLIHAGVASAGAMSSVRERWAFVAVASWLALLAAAALAEWSSGALALAAALSVRAAVLFATRHAGPAGIALSRRGPRHLDEVRATADPASFPKHVLAGNPRTISFFSAAFHGRNDCIHIADGRVGDALLVDIDDAKLSEMRAIYPDTWSYAAGDAYVVAEMLRAAGETFDLVVVDGWTGEAERMLTGNFPLWCSLSRGSTLMMASRPWFDAQSIEPTAAAVEEWAKRRHGIDVTVEELHFRADWKGGVWWIVVRAPGGVTPP